MRFSIPTTFLIATVGSSSTLCSTAFTTSVAPSQRGCNTAAYSTAVRAPPSVESSADDEENNKNRIWMDDVPGHDDKPSITPLTADEINARLEAQLDKMRQKDKNSIRLSKEVRLGFYEIFHICLVIVLTLRHFLVWFLPMLFFNFYICFVGLKHKSN